MHQAVLELNDTTFNGYMIALAISGAILVVLAIGGFFNATPGSRVVSGLVGLLFLGYATYLFLFFDGGSVFISWYVFVVPILVIVNAVKAKKASVEAPPAASFPPPPPPPAS